VGDREQAPFALWDAAKFQDGIVEADFILSKSCEFAALLFRARAEADSARGYELVLAPKSNEIELRKHAEKLQTLRKTKHELPIGRRFHLKIALNGGRVAVWVGEESRAVIEIEDGSAMSETGQIGIRTWGGTVSVEKLRVSSPSGTEINLAAGQNPDASRRALESFCLLMLNLNEMVYID
jgi:hypothetical protein